LFFTFGGLGSVPKIIRFFGELILTSKLAHFHFIFDDSPFFFSFPLDSEKGKQEKAKERKRKATEEN